MTKGEKEKLDIVLEALERLMRIFQIERIVYLVASIASFGLMVYAGYRLFSQETPKTSEMVIILGSSGVSTACSSRIVYFLNKAFSIIERIILSKPEEKTP